MGTEVFSHMNWLAVLAAGVAYFVLGVIWYSLIFKTAWIRLSGVNPNDPNAKKGVAGIMIASLILMIVASLGIAILLSKVGYISLMSGVKVGLVAGVCFSATGICISYLYEKRPLGLHMINAGYNVAGCVIAGIILAMWPK